MIELGVNIDHVATVRQARRSVYPDPIQAALLAEEAGADAITLHVREDRRHMQDADAIAIAPLLKTRMNFECALAEEMLLLVEKVRPSDVCLVPEKREEVTTEGGLDVLRELSRIRDTVGRLAEQGMRVSLFIDADDEQIHAAASAGAPVIELHTGRYADLPAGGERDQELSRIARGTELALSLGIKVNAGHGLRLDNVGPVAAITGISELNIGHAIVSDAIFMGWQTAIRNMKAAMIQARIAALRPR